MDSKPPIQAPKLFRRKVHVVYYLSRGGGQMDHPHLLEGYLSAAQDGLRLRDFKRWLAVLRGKSTPSTFSWSYKRTYKNGFIWHDLGDNDMIQPLSKNEYVLMGSEIRDQGGLVKCKCGGVQQQAETKVVAEMGDNQEEPLNKSVLRSPKITVANNATEDDQKLDAAMPNRCNSARLVPSENVMYDNKMVSKGAIQYKGGSSRSFNDLTAPRLIEEVKRPTNSQGTPKHALSKSFVQSRTVNARAFMIHDSELVAEDQSEIVEVTSNDEAVQGEPYEARREIRKGTSNSLCIKQGTSTPTSRRLDYNKDGNQEDMIGVMSDSRDNDDDLNGTYIMDAATQTGDSTRCSTDHQDGSVISAGYNDMLELVDSPGESAKYSEAHGYINTKGNGDIRRVSSARFNKNNRAGSGAVRCNLPKPLSREFPNLPDVEKAMMINQASDLGEDLKVPNSSSSNATSLLNHMGSPALSVCSAMSTRSTRFAREDNNRSSVPAVAKSSSERYASKLDSHHAHHKGSSQPSSTSTCTTPHTLLRQILTCGNADVVTENKPSEHVIMNSNALSGLQTPSRMISTNAYQGGHINGQVKKGSNGNNNLWACKSGLMKRISLASSDNKSVISATVSDQASVRDTLEMISSPESVYHDNLHLRNNIIKVNSLNFSSARDSHLRATSADTAGSASPGMLSVGSSTSRRSSIRESNMNVAGVANVDENIRESLRSHHVSVGASPKTRLNKGNKNTLLIHDVLDNEVSRDCKNLIETNSTTRGAKTNSSSIRELHKLICNPSGTPTCNNHNKVTSSIFATSPLEHHVYNTTRDSWRPQHHQSHHILIATHGPSRTPTRSSNLNSPNVVVLSKSLNSPSTSMFLEEISQPPPSSSSYISSWKELLWSPRYTSSHKDKAKRHMKP